MTEREIAIIDYVNLIYKAKDTVYGDLTYTNRHHILPKSLFPQFENDKENIVKMSFREHIQAHRLLVTIFPNTQMQGALRVLLEHPCRDREMTEDEIIAYKEENWMCLSEIYEYKGVHKSAVGWGEYLGINAQTFRDRVKRYKSVEYAIEMPYKNVKLYDFRGEKHTLREIADIAGLKLQVLRDRMTRYDTIEEAIEAKNKQVEKQITFKGQTLPVSKWAEKLHIDSHYLNARIRKYGIEKALTPSTGPEKFEYNGMKKTLLEWSEFFNMTKSALYQRLVIYGTIENAMAFHGNRYEYNGVSKTLKEWAEYANIPHRSFCRRFNKYGSIELAIENGKSEKTRMYDYNNERKNILGWAESLGIDVVSLKDKLKKYDSIKRAIESFTIKSA